MRTQLCRGPLVRPAGSRLPANHRLPAIYRLPPDETGEPLRAGELARDSALARVEAALVAADGPLTARRLAVVAGLPDGNEVRRLVRKLQGLYDQDATAFQVEEIAGGYQLLTRPEFHAWLARVRRTAPDIKLSAAARETLAIVAYRQPIMRSDIEAIRGVQTADVLRQLMERGLVRIAGRHDSLGRPVL